MGGEEGEDAQCPPSASLRQSVRHAGGELERVLFESWRRIVQEGVQGVDAQVEPFVQRHRDSRASVPRVCVGVVVGRNQGDLLVEFHGGRYIAMIRFAEYRSNQALGWAGGELLIDIGHGGL